jgi:hypothetical protein
VRTLAALVDMAAEGGGAADFNSAQHTQLLTREAMRQAIGLAM